MAVAKECDVCGTLYKPRDNSDYFHPTNKKIDAVIIQYRKGKDNQDLCKACKLHYLSEAIEFYEF